MPDLQTKRLRGTTKKKEYKSPRMWRESYQRFIDAANRNRQPLTVFLDELSKTLK